MVSFHTPLSPNRRKIVPKLENLLKKRKLGDADDDHDHNHNQDHEDGDHRTADQNPISAASQSSMTAMMTMMKPSKLDTELHLEARIPQEWQRCLDIKSGQMYFYNSRTKQRMLNDPRSSPEPPPPTPPSHGHMSLELELNLPCGSSSAKNQVSHENMITKQPNHHHQEQSIIINSTAAATSNNDNNKGLLSRAPSWLTFEEGEQEMVAAACRKCHMLVMMCKSSPSCPNCKFLHPPEQSTTPSLLKRRLSLLC